MSHMIVYISHGHSHADISDFSEETLAGKAVGPSHLPTDKYIGDDSQHLQLIQLFVVLNAKCLDRLN